MSQSCKSCKHLQVIPDALGRRIVRHDSVYPCRCPVPPLPPLPDSITKRFDFDRQMTERRNWMEGSDGVCCPTFENYKG
jgi:hypothetical protein